jgi:hypothetical protein
VVLERVAPVRSGRLAVHGLAARRHPIHRGHPAPATTARGKGFLDLPARINDVTAGMDMERNGMEWKGLAGIAGSTRPSDHRQGD